MSDKIRLLLIEDNRLLSEGFVAMFKDQRSIKVKAVTGRKDDVDQGINIFKPNLILLNSGLQSQNSLQVMRQVLERFPDIKMVVMGLSLSENEIIEFVDTGATGFIFKEATTLEFVKTIMAVASGEKVLPAHYADLLLSRIMSEAIVKGEFDSRESVQLTKFELELFSLLSDGLSNNEIGKKLKITPKRVNTHIHNIKQKLYLFYLLDHVPHVEDTLKNSL